MSNKERLPKKVKALIAIFLAFIIAYFAQNYIFMLAVLPPKENAKVDAISISFDNSKSTFSCYPIPSSGYWFVNLIRKTLATDFAPNDLVVSQPINKFFDLPEFGVYVISQSSNKLYHCIPTSQQAMTSLIMYHQALNNKKWI